MKKRWTFLVFLLCLSLAFGLAACGGGEKDQTGGGGGDEIVDTDPGDQEKNTVSKVTIKTQPTQTEYWVGDTFSVEGGVITATFKDKTTKDIPMTDKEVTVAAVNMSNPTVSKTVKVTYGGKSASFTIKIKEKGGLVTFDYNYSGAPAAAEVQSEKDVVLTQEEAPVAEREGYTFDSWYTDKDCTVAYLFDGTVDADITLYAGWMEEGAIYYDVTYDLNYYGSAVSTYTQIVKSGEAAREIALEPERAEFRFEGWYADAEGTTAFVAEKSTVTADMTVYAKWTKTKTGSSTYKFEAENVDMTGQEGPGLSGSASGSAMIVKPKNEGVSDKVISYLYKNGLHVDFCLASSEDAVSTLKVYVASEFDFNLNSGMYKIKLINSANEEGAELDYAAVQMVKDGPVVCITISGVQLKEGANVISLVTANSSNPTGVEGSGTYQGTAPMIDCIEIETSAVVTWDGVKGLPKDN